MKGYDQRREYAFCACIWQLKSKENCIENILRINYKRIFAWYHIKQLQTIVSCISYTAMKRITKISQKGKTFEQYNTITCDKCRQCFWITEMGTIAKANQTVWNSLKHHYIHQTQTLVFALRLLRYTEQIKMLKQLRVQEGIV